MVVHAIGCQGLRCAFLRGAQKASTADYPLHSGAQASFERSAALFAPKPMAASAVGEDDMFGDEAEDIFAANPATSHPVDVSFPSEPHSVETVAALPSPAESDSKAQAGSGVEWLPAASSTAAAGPQAADVEQRTDIIEVVDFGSWPIRELRRFLLERGQVREGPLLALIGPCVF